MGVKRLTIEDIKKQLHEKHGDSIDIDVNTYVNSGIKARFIDKDYGEWWALPYNVCYSGTRHPSRARKSQAIKNLISIDEILLRIKNKHADIVTLDTSSYVNLSTKAKFIDKDYGEWYALPQNVTSGHGHPKRGHTKGVDSRLIQERIHKIHEGFVVLDENSYIDMKSKARFIDKDYGEWFVNPGSVVTGRGHPARAAKKSAKTRKKHPCVVHWKTGELCYSDSSWEYATLLWLNENKYDFDWQVVFETNLLSKKGINLKYFIDLFIKSGPFKNVYVEIKGTWKRSHHDGTGKLKWDWFQSTHQNSQLWMKDKLEALQILVNGKPNPELLFNV